MILLDEILLLRGLFDVVLKQGHWLAYPCWTTTVYPACFTLDSGQGVHFFNQHVLWDRLLENKEERKREGDRVIMGILEYVEYSPRRHVPVCD